MFDEKELESFVENNSFSDNVVETTTADANSAYLNILNKMSLNIFNEEVTDRNSEKNFSDKLNKLGYEIKTRSTDCYLKLESILIAVAIKKID